MLFASGAVVFVAVIEGVAVGAGEITGVVEGPSAVGDSDGDGVTEIEVCTDDEVGPGVLLMTGDADAPVVFVAVIEEVAVGAGEITGVVEDPSVERELDTAVDDPDGDGVSEIEVCTDNGVGPGVLLMTGDANKPNVPVDNPDEGELTGFEVVISCPEDVVDPGILLMAEDVDAASGVEAWDEPADHSAEGKLTEIEVGLIFPEDVAGVLSGGLMPGDDVGSTEVAVWDVEEEPDVENGISAWVKIEHKVNPMPQLSSLFIV